MLAPRARHALVLGAILTLGCDAVLGIEDLPMGTADASAGDSFTHVDPACGACVETKCAAAEAACAADDACAALYDCIAKAPSDAADKRWQCESSAPVAAASEAYLALDRCRRTTCTSTCFAGTSFGKYLDPACGCLDQACAAQEATCVRSGLGGDPERPGDCERRLACLAHRTNPDTWVECNHYTGGAEFGEVLRCFRTTSCDACTMPEGNLSCGGAFSYPRATTPQVRFTLGVRLLAVEGDVKGTVTACRPLQCSPCVPADGPAPIVDGKATLNLPMLEGAYDGCFMVKPDPPDPDAGTVDQLPLLVMPGRRIRQDEAMLETYVAPRFVADVLSATLGKSVDPDRGHILGSVQDCMWQRVSGAEVALVEAAAQDDETARTYIDGIDARPELVQTTASGAFAIMNVKPGRWTLVARKGGVDVARVAVDVAKDTVTDANLYPIAR